MTPLIIIGCGGNALDLLDIVDAINSVKPTWEIVGVLDDARDSHGRFQTYPVLGKVADAQNFREARFINAIGSDKSFRLRSTIVAETRVPPHRFATLVHPAAAISARANLRHGTYVNYGVSIAGAVSVGNQVSIGANATIGHDTTLGDYTVVAPGATISGLVTVGTACYVGAAASIKQQVSIGSGALIGMAAVVIRNVTSESVVVGNPAREL